MKAEHVVLVLAALMALAGIVIVALTTSVFAAGGVFLALWGSNMMRDVRELGV